MENEREINPRPKNVKEFFTSWHFWKPFIAILIGTLAGYLFYHFVGCKTGSCPITNSAWSTMTIGGLIGFFIVSGPTKETRNN